MHILIEYSIKKDTENYLGGVFEFKHLKHGRENIREDLLAKIDPILRNKIEKTITAVKINLPFMMSLLSNL